MFNILNLEKLSLIKRLMILVIFPVLLTIIFGFFALKSLNFNKNILGEISSREEILLSENNVLNVVHSKIRDSILNIDSGKFTWNEGLILLTENREKFNKEFKIFNQYSELNTLDKDKILITIKNAMPEFLSALDDVIEIVKSENKAHLKLFILEEMYDRMNPLINAVTQHQQENIKQTNQGISNTLEKIITDENIILLLLIANLFFLLLLGYLVFKSISKQTNSLTSTIDELNRGNISARTSITGSHELARLGRALNHLLDERDQIERNIQQENNVLNDSVFSLLESVADLSERNLTVRATVTEDITGPLADAINQLTIDTSIVLNKVQTIATSVESASKSIDQRTLVVKDLAESEYYEAQKTSEAVNNLINRLNQIADSSSFANDIAHGTIQATKKAYQSVSKTRNGMLEIREMVKETGKRIERLGEQSQEITHIIDLINTITERTTVLALNAGIQALSAGEAGKGFSVIAEEIQRLAENSRESTNQIAHVTKNIQHEIRTTMLTMDNTIKHVMSGSSLAEEASEQMQLTLDATNKLTDSVKSIAHASKEQVEISHNLHIRSTEILKATQSTGKEMESLRHLTKNMVDDAKELVYSVGVFKLQ